MSHVILHHPKCDSENKIMDGMYGTCCFGREDIMAGKTVVGVPLGRLYYPLTTFCPIITDADEKKATQATDPLEDAIAKMKKWDARFCEESSA